MGCAYFGYAPALRSISARQDFRFEDSHFRLFIGNRVHLLGQIFLASSMQSRYKNRSMTSNHAFTSPRLRRLFCSLFFVAAAVAALGAFGSSRASSQNGSPNQGATTMTKIAPWVIDHTANGQQAEFFVVLADQADLSGAAALATKNEKGRYVYDALWNKSQATQGPVLQWLSERGLEHQSFYIVNAILVKGTREIAETLATRPDVVRVEGNPLIHNSLPQPGPVTEVPSKPQVPKTIEPGIAYTHAPDVWALGFTGQNIVVASADTGQRWTHNALKPHYRGWDGVTADHDYNWHDSIHDSVGNPCGNDSPQPCDDFFHGTHTTGTAIGDDGGTNQIGMAPGAKWIGCRNMDVGTGTPARYIECMEFFLAPTRWAVARATRPKLLTLRSTPGVARHRKVVQLTRWKLLLKLKLLQAL